MADNNTAGHFAAGIALQSQAESEPGLDLSYADVMAAVGALTANDFAGGIALVRVLLLSGLSEAEKEQALAAIRKRAGLENKAIGAVRKEIDAERKKAALEFLAAEKKADLERRAREPLPEGAERFCMVKTKQGLRVVERRDDGTFELWKPGDFCLRYPEVAGDTKPSDAPWFARKDVPVYQGFQFQPDAEKAAEHPELLNRWRGFAVSPRRGSWRWLRHHVWKNVCRRDDDLFHWMMTWLAHIVQHPGEKIGSCVVLIGEQGTGKTFLFDWVRRLTAPHSSTISNSTHLLGRFNEHLADCIFLQCEETVWGGDVKQAEGVWKTLITNDVITIEGKYEAPMTQPNFLRVAMTANPGWVLPVSPGDRRPLILEMGTEHLRDNKYFARIDREMRNGGLEAMMHDLLHMECDFSILRFPPVTAAKGEQIVHSLDAVQEFFLELANGSLAEGVLVGGSDMRLDDEPNTVTLATLKGALMEYLRERGKLHLAKRLHRAGREILGPEYSDRVRIRVNNKTVNAVTLPSRAAVEAHLLSKGVDIRPQGEVVEKTKGKAGGNVTHIRPAA